MKAVGLRRLLMEELVEFAKEATGLADDTMELPEEVPEVARETAELVESLLAPM